MRGDIAECSGELLASFGELNSVLGAEKEGRHLRALGQVGSMGDGGRFSRVGGTTLLATHVIFWQF